MYDLRVHEMKSLRNTAAETWTVRRETGSRSRHICSDSATVAEAQAAVLWAATQQQKIPPVLESKSTPRAK